VRSRDEGLLRGTTLVRKWDYRSISTYTAFPLFRPFDAGEAAPITVGSPVRLRGEFGPAWTYYSSSWPLW